MTIHFVSLARSGCCLDRGVSALMKSQKGEITMAMGVVSHGPCKVMPVIIIL